MQSTKTIVSNINHGIHASTRIFLWHNSPTVHPLLCRSSARACLSLAMPACECQHYCFGLRQREQRRWNPLAFVVIEQSERFACKWQWRGHVRKSAPERKSKTSTAQALLVWWGGTVGGVMTTTTTSADKWDLHSNYCKSRELALIAMCSMAMCWQGWTSIEKCM